MALFKTITQGGQVHIHQLLMLKQVSVVGLVVSLIGGGGYFAWDIWKNVSPDERSIASQAYWAKFMPPDKHPGLKHLYTPPQGSKKGKAAKPYERTILSMLKDPFIQKTTERVEKYVEQTAYVSLQVTGGLFVLIAGLWFFIGIRQKQSTHNRGNTLIHWKELRRLMKRRREASDLKLYPDSWLEFGHLPLVKGKETFHTLITGTTGSGKTNAFHQLLPRIRRRKDRAIVVDLTGSYVSRYYDETRDILLNPLDKRSVFWHPWADCHLDSHYDVLAEAFIQPKKRAHDPFWDTASRAVFKTALRKYAAFGNRNVEQLYTFLMTSSEKEFETFFKGTEAATFAFKNGDKTTQSIRGVLSSQIECLRQLETSKVEEGAIQTNDPQDNLPISGFPCSSLMKARRQVFSIREWVMDEKQKYLPRRKRGSWIFITARPDQRPTLIPLISAWVDIAMNALMVLPESQKRRLWFIMDELAALQKLPSLPMGLAEGRKYGGCFLVGFQSKPQLEERYGRNATDAMLDLFNTKAFFRCLEPATQAWISKVLGDKEEAEPTESISFGVHSMRDGVSLSRHTKQTPLVMPSELSQLKDREFYIKYSGDYPVTWMQAKYKKGPFFKIEPFLLKPEKQREYLPLLVEDSYGVTLEEEVS